MDESPALESLSTEELFVKAILEDKGAKVDPMPRTSEKTPDFDVDFSGVQYIVEVKTKEEDETSIGERRQTLQRGEVYGESAELKRKNTISGIIKWGVEQLANYGSSETFRVLWIHCGGFHSERFKHQFFTAFCGSTRLRDLEDSKFQVNGLYFRDSDFFRDRSVLDGAVITMELHEECKLFCLANDHSAKYEAFRASPLAKAFPAGFYDPLAEEAAGDAIVIRGNIDRRQPHVVQAHLSQSTGRAKLYNTDFNIATATVAVPKELLR